MRVTLTDAAQADLAATHVYCAEPSGSAADEVLGALLRAINGLGLFPLMGKPGVVPETRERVTTRYAYRIAYHIDEVYKFVEVWRVLHDARRWPVDP